VNQWLNPLKCGTSSNLVDMGWAAVHVDFLDEKTTPMSVIHADQEATVNVCGVTVTRPQGKSWAPILPTGTWRTWEPPRDRPSPRTTNARAGKPTVG
jgi:hypothetical protein